MTVHLPPDALDECAREPIHIPGAIQPHGALIALTVPGFEVTHVSRNVDTLLGLPEGSITIGKDLRQYFSRAVIHDLGNTLQAASIARVPERLHGIAVVEGAALVDVIAHATADGAICEFLPAAGPDSGRVDSAALLRAMTARLSRAVNTARLLSLAAQQVRAVTGYDRVMIYRFQADHSGVVVAEALRGGLEPYLGLHYPASDIPPQARELFRRQPLRQIPDVRYTPVPIVPGGPNDPPLDLTLSQLRSASSVHLEYLRNMGSAATLTISIMRGDALWGLFACHHERPRRLSSMICVAMELFAQMFSLQLEAREQASELADAAKAHAVVDALREAGVDRPVSEAIEAIRNDVQALLPHDGLVLWIGGIAESSGVTPPGEQMPELVRHLRAVSPNDIYATSRLSTELPDALRYTAEASGVLAIPLSRGRQDFLMLFRREEVQTVTWGGDPNKAVTPGSGGRIGPRQSFSAWKEIVRGASMPWRKPELQLAELLQIRLLELLLSRARYVDEGRQAAAESQKLLIAELGHRVKNIFALIRSVVRQSRIGADTIDSYSGDLERRIAALAIAHDQVTHVGWRPASLRQLVEEQARTWSDGTVGRFTIEGLPVQLDVRALQAFALVLHEMMTNAAKYGALSTPGGTIAVRWTMGDAGLAIAWRETGGPPVTPPTRRGFGTTVIEQSIPFELQGKTDVRYEATGVVADFLIPPEHAVIVEADEKPASIAPAPVMADLRGKKLLLVEDSMMIALDAQAALEAIGATVEIASSVADGLRAVSLTEFTGAVLDVNLRGETSSGLADALLGRQLPFVFATGYGDQINIPERFRTIPKVSKPYDAATIAAALRTAELLAGMPAK